MELFNLKSKIFFFLISFICMVTHGKPLHKKLQTLGSMFNNVEIRLNIKANDLIALQEAVSGLNETFADKSCPTDDDDTKDDPKKGKEMQEIGDIKTTSDLLLKAFKDEKSWIHNEIMHQGNRIEDLLIRLQQQMKNEMEVLEERAETVKNNIKTELWNEIKELNSKSEQALSSFTSIEELMKTHIAGVNQIVEALNKAVAETDKRIADKFTKHDNTESKLSDEIEKIKAVLDARATCPRHWKEFMGYCYLLYTNGVNFDSAIGICEQSSAFLADIKSEDENSYVKTLSSRQIWIGISDREKEGEWVMVRNGKKVDYTNWYSTQPQNFATYDEDCGVMVTGGEWHDFKCNRTFPFVCKKMVT